MVELARDIRRECDSEEVANYGRRYVSRWLPRTHTGQHLPDPQVPTVTVLWLQMMIGIEHAGKPQAEEEALSRPGCDVDVHSERTASPSLRSKPPNSPTTQEVRCKRLLRVCCSNTTWSSTGLPPQVISVDRESSQVGKRQTITKTFPP